MTKKIEIKCVPVLKDGEFYLEYQWLIDGVHTPYKEVQAMREAGELEPVDEYKGLQ